MLQACMEPTMTSKDIDENVGSEVASEGTRDKNARRNIIAFLHGAGMTYAELSRQIDRDDGYISQYLSKRKTKKLPHEVAVKIAEVMGVDVRDLLSDPKEGHDGRGPLLIPFSFAGTAETGVHRTMANIETESESRETISEVPFTRQRNAHHFWIDVRDDSMSGRRKAIEKGHAAICVDLASAGGVLRLNKVYVIRRSADGGKTWETILRQASKIMADKIEFSSQPAEGAAEKFEVTWPLSEESMIKVLGRVYRWGHDDRDEDES